MRRYISLLLFIGLAWGQSKMDIDNLIDIGGLLYAPNNNKPYTGIVFDFYENGTEKLNGRYRNGIKNGKWTWWNDDGGMDSTGNYKNGLMNGIWQFYDSNGNLEAKGSHKNGEKDGKWTWWNENGKKNCSLTYDNGNRVVNKDVFYKQDGSVKEPIDLLTNLNFSERDNIATTKDKDEPYFGPVFYTEPDGDRGEGILINGKLDGLHTMWYENGQKKKEGIFKDGKQDGLHTMWHENGQKRRERTYKDGKEDGLITKWYENGQKSLEGIWKDGQYDGLLTWWYDNGQKKREETYKDGESFTSKCWDEDGNECECGEYWWECCK